MMVQEMKKFHCVGCGRFIPWNGKGVFAYECPCGATLFADEKGNFSLPASLMSRVVGESREIPHSDHYLGISNFVSMEKQKAFDMLTKLGSVWSWNCKECRDRIVKLRRAQMKAGLIKFELHPELKALL